MPKIDPAALAALGSLLDPTRRRLFELVMEAAEPVAREQLAAAAGVSRSLAAYHLDELVDRGLLTASYERPPGRGGPGAGRPPKLYQLADDEVALHVPYRDYRLLAELLARSINDSADAAQAAQAAARNLGTRLGAAARAVDHHPHQALQSALEAGGYEPFEAAPGLLRLGNCPFASIAANFPTVVCSINLALVEGQLIGLGADGMQAVLAPQDNACCVAIRTTEAARPA
jgi:predicted ArsR family transcriptional regulator